MLNAKERYELAEKLLWRAKSLRAVKKHYGLPMQVDTESLRYILARKFQKKSEIKEFCETFQKEIALNPSEVQKILGCNVTERKRWAEDGRLKVVGEDSIKSYGKWITFNKFDYYQICYEITPEKISKWREGDKAKKRKKLCS